MKVFSPILILLFVIPLVHNLSKTEKRFVGSWTCTKVDFSESMIGMNEEEKALYEAFLPMMEEIFLSFKMNLKVDGTMTTEITSDGAPEKEDGTWQVSPEGKNFIITSNGSSDTLEVESFSKKEMVFVLDADDMKIKMTMVKSKN